MAEASAPIMKLLEELTKLPGIGPKSAERIAHFLLAGDRKVAVLLAEALREVVEKVRPCSECFNLTEGNLCPICRDPRRDAGLICVVESPRDVTLFERAGSFRGLYHVLGGRLAPLDGVGPDRLTLNALVQRVRKGGVREVILATSPTLEGDGTALHIQNLMQARFPQVQITRLARGLPAGSNIEYANRNILADAISGRQKM